MHNNKGVKRRTLLAAGLSAALPVTVAKAQVWPAKTVTLVVPFAPGGGTDTFARPFAAKLAQQIGQQVIIDNRAGAGGTVGAAVVARHSLTATRSWSVPCITRWRSVPTRSCPTISTRT